MRAYDLQYAMHLRGPGPKPDPEAAAIRLGLQLRPVAGGQYRFDGRTITYDALQPLAEQRLCIARALVVHVWSSRMLLRESMASVDRAARHVFDLE